ncbi:glycosyl transferase [Cypionkella aquatica]|uniref:Glycosyl transferase n=1 Tax=Cypionkella aquatica TaxID=1756042 RepID=A0AA37WZJ4_9RHOB|nr:glycosyltransferase [Cypionkella aquatica]GLS86342.1 glycosyl transferase [Cypionkella aquatica]
MTPKSPSVFFYVQHLLGIGHLARASRIARAMLDLGMEVTLVTGGLPVQGFPGPGISHIALPPLAVAGSEFAGLVTASGEPADAAYLEARKNQLLAAYHAAKPDIVLTEAFPFGRRQVRFELLPLIDAIQASESRPALVSSVRDILQRRIKPGRNEETVALVESAFDLVLVHGDPSFAALGDSFALADQLTKPIAYSGLVCPPAPPLPTETFDVLVSAGGGAAGKHLITDAIGAAALLPHLANWLIITGPNLAQADYDALNAKLPPNVTLARFRVDLASLMRGAKLSVSQAGYNTVADVLMAGCRALLVPYAVDGETEQTDRATLLKSLGRCRALTESSLTATSLAAAIKAEIERPMPSRALAINLNGATRSAEILRDLAQSRARA